MSRSIEKRARFDFIRYANCWEDPATLCAALEPGPGKRMLSIASGGDNAFVLLATGAEVVAADVSAAQLACVELKAAAIRTLEREGALAFLGVRASSKRLVTYATLRAQLGAATQAFWDRRRRLIRRGIVHAGKFERYFRFFRRFVLPLIHNNEQIDIVMENHDRDIRQAYYDNVWNNRRWRLMFKLFFSRFVMGLLGRDREFFRYVQGPVSDVILKRTERALVALPTHVNPYLDYILTGNFVRALPLYLRPGMYASVKAHLDNLTLFHGRIEDAARMHRGAGFDGFNLSDIFEYMDKPACAAVYAALLETARPGARFAYWNMLVPRRAPHPVSERVRSLDELSLVLHEQDMAFFYEAFVVEEAL